MNVQQPAAPQSFQRYAEFAAGVEAPRPEIAQLSVVIPALKEHRNLALLVPELRTLLESLGTTTEVLVVTQASDTPTIEEASRAGVRFVIQEQRGYGGALLAGFAAANGKYILTMDPDLSHPPAFIRDLWHAREGGEITIASRYVSGGSAQMAPTRYALSRTLNLLFRRGLSLGIHDLSSGFRLYKASILRGGEYQALDFDILQRILVQAYADGWRIHEIPFVYAARRYGASHRRVSRLGRAYLRTFLTLWKLRNSIMAADYDDRAYDSPIWLQRYWQRSRFKHVTELITGHGPDLMSVAGPVGLSPPFRSAASQSTSSCGNYATRANSAVLLSTPPVFAFRSGASRFPAYCARR